MKNKIPIEKLVSIFGILLFANLILGCPPGLYDPESSVESSDSAGSPEISVLGPISFGSLPENLLSGSTVDFGFILTSREITFTIINDGTEDLVLESASPNYVILQNSSNDDFDIAMQPSQAIIPPGEGLEGAVRITAPGPGRTTTTDLVILSNDPNQGKFVIKLTGLLA